MPTRDLLRDVPVLALSVRDFSVTESIVMALVIALGISFVTWLIAGYYERRGGFGKK